MQHAETSRLRVVAPTEARRDDAAEEAVIEPNAELEGLVSPGRYIRDQRKRQGMSLDQLAAATKIPRSSLELLEEDLHDALPGPVFVKGFLRCCARALSVEPETVMELVYERERALLVARRRERPSAPHPTEAVAPEPSASAPSTPRPTETSAPVAAGGLRGLFPKLPSVSLMLWVVVALLVAMVMMAAFNLLGHGSVGPT